MNPLNLIEVAEAMLQVLNGILHEGETTERGPGRKLVSLPRKIVLFFVKQLKISSERGLEEKLNGEYRKLLKTLGLTKSPDHPRPLETTQDHSTFSVWRRQLGGGILDKVIKALVKKAVELNAIRGKLVAVDSTAFEAYCNPRKRKLSDEDAAWRLPA